ncbi:hypothetical protein AB6A40_005113 [Gnathostoma spinigerum]|uniref:Uncharacterized protein n=1 Tax=Gnathostoma spinigerum TaxID=75299 RepID=A0ABD6EEH6_9BILA
MSIIKSQFTYVSRRQWDVHLSEHIDHSPSPTPETINTPPGSPIYKVHRNIRPIRRYVLQCSCAIDFDKSREVINESVNITHPISEKAKVSHQTVGPERGKRILKPPSEHMEGLYTKGVNHQNEASMENSHAEPEEIKLEENGHNDGEQSSPERLEVGDERSECVTTFDATKESKVKSVFESVHTEKEGYFKTNNEGAGDAVSSQHVNVNNILFSRGPENNSAEAILPEKVTHKEPALEFEVIPSSQLNVGESPDRHLETSTTAVAGTADTRKVELTDEHIPENSFTDTDEICLVSNEKISAAKDSESPVSEQMLFSSVNDISIESTIELTAANASEPVTLDVRLKSMNTGEALTVDVQEKPRVPVVKSSPSNATMPSHNDAEKASNKLATKTLPPYITHVVPAPEPEVLQEAKTASQFGMTHERLRNVMIVTGVIAGVSGVCGVAYYLYTRSK